MHLSYHLTKSKKCQQHNEEKSNITFSKLRSQRLKKLLQTWHNYAHLICRKRRAILGTCVSMRRRILRRGWQPWVLKSFSYPSERRFALSQATLSNYIRRNWRKNKLKCMLQRWHRFTNKRIRLEQLMVQHLIKVERSLQIQSNVDMETQCAKITTKTARNSAPHL